MNSPQPNEERTCSDCGATLREKGNSCWLCHLALRVVVPAGTEPPAPSAGRARAPVAAGGKPVVIFERRAAYQFSLATLMLLITLCAVVLGVFRMSPGLGIVLVIIATPAWVRTCISVTRRKARGQPMSQPEKLNVFAGSVGVVVIIGVAAGIAFFATCWAGFFGGAVVAHGAGARGYHGLAWGLVTGVALGILVGLYVGYRLIRRLWPRKD